MKRDQAAAKARADLATTGIPQAISKNAQGDWNCRPITALRNRCADCGGPIPADDELCVGCSIMYRQDAAEPVS